MSEFAVSRKTVRKRLIFGFVTTVLLTLFLISRLAWIQIVRADELYDQAWEQWNHTIPINTDRGSIYDRHGRLFAGITQVQTIAVIPPQITEARAVAEALAPVLEMDSEKIYELINLDKSAVYIKRKVSPEVAEAVREMSIPGIVFFNEEKRDYPGGNLASQLLGFVGMDQGWSGLEVYYEDYLSGSEGRLFYPADNLGRQVPHDFNRYIQPRHGFDLYLTIDETIQHIVEKELDRVMQEATPLQAMAVAVDPRSGAVLAIAARPDFEPSNYDQYDPNHWLLSPVTSSFEPGSTFKIITLAAVVEESLFNPEEHYDCPGYSVVNGRRINCWTVDRGGHGDISFFDAVGGSCNTVFIELANRLGKEKFLDYIEAFGFGKSTGIDYPGEGTGAIFSSEQMGQLELATASFGQGVSVTPIQQVMAIAAIANGGYLYKPYLLSEVQDQYGDVLYNREPELVRQVISQETSETVTELMESVLITGTGTTAAPEGYRAAGKTGTAEKLGPDGLYSGSDFIYSFVGFAPVEDPRIVLYVAVDGVTKGPRFGSYTSAPFFKRVVEEVLNYMQVTPSSTLSFED
jgi:stage V sporulation protein D (sporulation-specific penicillin-binding protein)